MKHLSIALICAFFMAGCAYKNETLNLASYAPQYTGVKVKERKTVFLRIVRDTRNDKNRIGSLLENGRVIAPLLSNADFENRYRGRSFLDSYKIRTYITFYRLIIYSCSYLIPYLCICTSCLFLYFYTGS